MMKTFGNPQTQTLVSLVLTKLPGAAEESYDPNQLCPPGQFWLTDPRAPWNQPYEWFETREGWITAYPALADRPVDDLEAPWNLAPPSRDPADYPGLLWGPPALVPLVKLEAPVVPDPATQVAEPTLVWHEDRVERDWVVRDRTPEELAAAQRMVREATRSALRGQWDQLCGAYPWLNTFRKEFEAANVLLDEGRDAGAVKMILRTPVPADYDEASGTMVPALNAEERAIFRSIKQQFADALTALPR